MHSYNTIGRDNAHLIQATMVSLKSLVVCPYLENVRCLKGFAMM